MMSALLFASAGLLFPTHAVHFRRSGGLVREDPDFAVSCPENGKPTGLNFHESSMAYSNLGGHGPDEGMSQGMLFKNVFANKQGIDMLVSVTSPYFPVNVDENRMNGEFFGINVGPGATVSLKVSFLEQKSEGEGEDGLTQAPEFIFTVAGVDELGGTGGARQMINVSGSAAYAFTEDSDVLVVDNSSWAAFESDALADSKAPRHAYALDDELKKKSVSFFFTKTKEFTMSLSVSNGADGRTFYFTAASSLVCDEMATCDEYECPEYWVKWEKASDTYCAADVCSEEDLETCCEFMEPEACAPTETLLFPPDSLVHSNLAGKGPDFNAPESILYTNVFPASGEMIYLNITTESHYICDNSSKNGLHGEFSVVNVEAGSEVDLLFSFLTPKGKPFKLDYPFFFTVYDFDQQIDGGGKEQVTVSGYESYVVSNTTSVVISTDKRKRTVFTSSAYGNESDNPVDPVALSQKELDKTVSIKFPRRTDHFSVTLGATTGFSGRNFEFTGYSTQACPVQDVCESVTCPAGTALLPEAEHMVCAGIRCNETDIPTCCFADGSGKKAKHAAMCSTYTCPAKMTLVEDAAKTACADKVCTDFDVDTCCEIDLVHWCKPEYQLVLSNLVFNNIGRHALKGVPKEMRFEDVFPHRGDGKQYDLIVKVRGDRSIIGSSGLLGDFGKILFSRETNSIVEFEIVHHHSDGAPAHDIPFLFSIVDLDVPRRSVATTAAVVENGWQGMRLSRKSRLHVSEESGLIEAVTARTESSDPPHPMSLAKSHKRSSATFLMNRTSFKLNLTIEKPFKTGLKLLFAGATNLVCPMQASCETFSCPAGYTLRDNARNRVCRGSICEEEDLTSCCVCSDAGLKFSTKSMVESNLGGMGPGEGAHRLLLANVFPHSPDKVDLEVTSVTPYYSYNSSHNGLNGEFLSINVRSGTTVDFKFKFLVSGTGEAYKAHPFFFSVFDLDKQVDGGGAESVMVSPHLWSKMAEKTFIVENTNGMFEGTAPGTEEDNPSNALALSDDHVSRSVTFMMDRSSSFLVRLSAAAGWHGRNVLFAGNSVVTCERRSLCTNFTCPKDHVLRSGANRTVCKGAICLKGIDNEACCTKPTSWRAKKITWHH